MPDALKGVFVFLLLIFGFILYPTLRSADLSDRSAEKIAESATQVFVDTARGKGYVDVRDYKVFRDMLDRSGVTFQVTIEHYKRVNQPVYSDPNNPATFQNTFSVNYLGYFNDDILDVLYPGNSVTEDDPSRRYIMHVGDLFNVRLKSKGVTLGSRMYKVLFKRDQLPIIVLQGGMVRDEAP